MESFDVLLTRRVMKVIRPRIARTLVTWMRKIEESTLDPATRWELMRKTLERMERDDE